MKGEDVKKRTVIILLGAFAVGYLARMIVEMLT
jgi:hypothetical protein